MSGQPIILQIMENDMTWETTDMPEQQIVLVKWDHWPAGYGVQYQGIRYGNNLVLAYENELYTYSYDDFKNVIEWREF